MSKSFRQDLTGQRFGRLTVIEFVPTEDRRTHWKCLCDCGKEKITLAYLLKEGGTVSCGCQRKETPSFKFKTHGGTKTKLYRVWCAMKNRCYRLMDKSYNNYGKRGITVCEEWKTDFAVFKRWALENGYKEGLTLDRIDVNGNYTPDNCRWVDRQVQARNTRSNTIIEYDGEKMCLAEAAEKSGISYAVLRERYHHGDKGEYLFRPVKK